MSEAGWDHTAAISTGESREGVRKELWAIIRGLLWPTGWVLQSENDRTILHLPCSPPLNPS